MRIGVVTTSYPRFAGDPAGNFVAGHVGALRALGHHVDVLAAGPVEGDRGDAAALHRADGDPSVGRIASRLFYRGGAPDLIERAPIGAAGAAAMFTARLTAAVAARRGRWDAVIAHWLVPSAIAALACDAPMMAIAHGGDVFTLRRFRLLGPVLRALHRRDARLAFVSAQLRTVAREAAPALARWIDAAIVQPMGVELARFAALTRAPAEPPIVLVAARLVPIKGVDVAIEAMQHVRRGARLVIAGDGPERTRLTAMASIAHASTTGAHGLAAATGPPRTRPTERCAAIDFIGEVATARRDELLRGAAVVVVPSRIARGGRSEGTPAIAIEALAAGVPVVASAVGGLRELPGVRLVPPEDPRALARAIDEVLAAPPAAEALRACVANLDWRAIAPRLLRE